MESQEPLIIDPPHKHGEARVYKKIVPTLQERMGTGGNIVPYVYSQMNGMPKQPKSTGKTLVKDWTQETLQLSLPPKSQIMNFLSVDFLANLSAILGVGGVQ